MGDSARDLHQSAPALRAAIAAIIRGGAGPVSTSRGLRAAALSGLCILALAPGAGALSLGDLEMRSSLGEPLNAQVPITLGAGESLASSCVGLGAGSGGLAPVAGLRLQTPAASQPGTYTIRLSTQRPLHEPMYGIELRVACPGTPVVVRQFVLMLDLPGTPLPAAAAQPATPQAINAPAASGPAAGTRSPDLAPAPAAAPPPRQASARVAPGPITQGSTYQVASGDTLSLIAQRVAGRNGVGIWDMAALIQQANPAAFINNDADRIRLGAEIVIPVLGAAPAAPVASAQPVPAAPAAISAPAPAPEPIVTAQPPGPVPRELPAPPEALADSAGISLSLAADQASAPATSPEVLPTQQAAVATPVPVAERAGEPAADSALLAPPTPARRGANPLLATAVGLGLGLVISLLFGRFSLAGMRRSQTARKPGQAAPTAVPVARQYTADQAGMTVVESPADEAATPAAPEPAAGGAIAAAAGASQPAARPLAGLDWQDLDEDITDELSALFGDEDPEPWPGAAPASAPATAASPEPVTASVPAASEAAAPFGEVPPAAALEQTDLDSVDPSATAALSGLAWDSLDDSIEDTLDVPPASSLRADETGTSRSAASGTAIDLPALTASATHDEKLSQSLVEALQLLEQDYQQELTATQLAPAIEPTETMPVPVAEPTETMPVPAAGHGDSNSDTAEQPAPEKLRRQRAG